MEVSRYRYDPPSLPLLRWLVDPGPRVPADIRDILLGKLLSSPKAVVMGVINGLVLNATALILHFRAVFVLLLAMEIGCSIVRLASIRAVRRAVERGARAPMNFYVAAAVVWCSVQGAMAFMCQISDRRELQIMSAATIMALLGPVCARNYPAPRLACALVCVCYLPFLAGSAFSGEAWLLVMVLQAPLFFLGSMMIVTTFQEMAVDTLKAEQNSQHRANHDALTGLINRHGFTEILAREATGTAPHVVVMCLDLDGFKQVNDTHGHPAGDSLLQAVARRLEACVRPGDSIVRLGGDEFVILVWRMPSTAAPAFAERIIDHVTNEPYLLDGVNLARIGVSIGLACAPEDGTSLTDLHAKADAALYQAKRAGKGVQRRFMAAA